MLQTNVFHRIAMGSIVTSCLLMLTMVDSVGAETRYFKVAEWSGEARHGDSYVLPLSDPLLIDHAQDLIDFGPAAVGATIVVAKIAPGSDGINRDFNQPGDPLWSWHVTQVEGFFDVTIEILDGTPSMVENDVPFWMANTNGMIGFWSYTVVEDITSQVPEPGSLSLGLIGIAAMARRHRKSSSRSPDRSSQCPRHRHTPRRSSLTTEQ